MGMSRIVSEKTTDGGLRIPDLSIKGFRGIRELHISKLGRVTLITGKNNVGKSSILEALRLYARSAAPDALDDIVEFREEDDWADGDERLIASSSLFRYSTLFHGFPQLGYDFKEIAISASGEGRPAYLKMRLEWHAEIAGVDGLVSDYDIDVDWDALIPVLVVETEARTQIRRLDIRVRPSYTHFRFGSAMSSREHMRCVALNPYSGKESGTLDELWSGIALTDNEHEVVKALRIISPEISAVSMVKGGSDERIAIARSRRLESPIPLRSFGDGVNRLFAIVLSLVSVRGGLLLIDEFENGLHHSVQLDVWRMIFRLARKLDVQVFATTHSQDAVKAFQKAASESPGEDSLVLLTRRDDDVIPTALSERELAIANRHNMQVRG